MSYKNQTDLDLNYSLPNHVAIIMDGNSRWARRRGQSHIFGYQAGIESVRRSINFSIFNKIKILTLYAFSSENWRRPSKDISDLMELFTQALDNEINILHKNNIKLCVIGNINKFSKKLQNSIRSSEELTKNNNRLILIIAANYGGRWDIIQGVRKIASKVHEGILRVDQINEETLCKVVCMSDLDPVDLVIRTGGEKRISNFLLWQIAYSELFFTDVLWPDFDDSIFRNALKDFSKRNRRFGA